MARLVIDPITRIEGHLRIEAQMDGGKVTDAWSSGTMFRGMEIILKDRDPREAWIWAQRICGVCTVVHALASVRAVENALGVDVPENARLVRNLLAGSQMVQDHVIHFYHLHALDWVDVASALKADPSKTSQIAQSISDYEKSSTTYFRGIQQRVKTLVESGQLSLFASGYWGHPAYRLPPEVNLLAVAHYLEALAWQKDFIRIHAALGGKNPHPQTFLVGGMSTAMDANEPFAVINPERITFLEQLLKGAKKFVEQVYIPDVLAVAPYYMDWFSRGEVLGNFLSYGDYASANGDDPKTFMFPRGIVLGRDLTKVYPVDPQKITESVSHSWYEYSTGDAEGRHPSVGETNPKYSGPKPPFTSLDVDKKYSWVKSPRYDGKSMEVGPLARMIVGYASGQKDIKAAVDGCAGDGAVLNAGAASFARAGIRPDGQPAPGLVGSTGHQHGSRQCQDFQSDALGSRHMALPGDGLRMARSPARILGALGGNWGPIHQELSGGGSHHLECRSARRARTARRLRSVAGIHAGGRSVAAAGDSAHHSLFRSVPGLRGARHRCPRAQVFATDDAVSVAPRRTHASSRA